MVRRKQKAKVGDRLQNPIPLLRVPCDSRFPDNCAFQANADARCRKRVRFVGVDEDDSRMPLKEVRAENSTDPKTSEYAFFKKLKSDAIHQLKSTSRHEVKKHSKMVEPSNLTRGSDNPFNSHNSDSYMSPENKQHVNHGFSPDDATPKEPERSVAMGTKDKNMMPQSKKLGLGGNTDDSGDIYTTKRKKLHQWIRETSFPDIDELTTKGYDLVSLLVDRLLPSRVEKHNSRTPIVAHTGNTFINAFASRELDLFSERHHQTAMGNFSVAEPKPEFGNGRSIFYLDMPRERTTTCITYPISDIHEGLIPRNSRDFMPEFQDNYLMGYVNESVLSPPFRNYRTLPSSHLEENDDIYCLAKSSFSVASPPFQQDKFLQFSRFEDEEDDEFYGLDKLSSERNSSALLLDWAPISQTNSDNLHPICHDRSLIRYPIENQWIGNNPSQKLCLGNLYLSSLPFDHRSDISTCYLNRESGTSILQDKDFADFNCSASASYHAQSMNTEFQDYYYDNRIFQDGFSYPGTGIHVSLSGFNGSWGKWECLPPSYSPVDHNPSAAKLLTFCGEDVMDEPITLPLIGDIFSDI